MSNKFKTRVNLELYLDRTDNYDVETKQVEIEWDLEIDVRSWGLKDLSVSVPDQKITVFLNVWGDEQDTEEELVLDVKNVLVERQEGELSSLAPCILELFKGKWRLVF